MRTINLALAPALAAAFAAGACSSPLRSDVDANHTRAGGSSFGSGGSTQLGSGVGGTSGVAGTGGTRAIAGTGGVGEVRYPDAGVVLQGDAIEAQHDVAMTSSDALPGEDGRAGAGTGGVRATGGAAGSSAVGGSGGSGTIGTDPRPSLRKFVGSTYTSGEVRSDFLRYWDQLTPESSGKLQAVSSEYMQYDWSTLDTVYAFTREHRIPFHEVALIYHTSAPIALGTGDRARAGVEDWIRSFCARYPDTELIDVIYEPLHSPVIFKDALGGAGASGYDWMIQAFKWARAYCPRSILLLTDYNNVEYQSENQATIDIVEALLAAGAPIDAIGVEGHDAARTRTSTLKAYIDKLAATGLPLYVTEYDIAEEEDASQEAIMKEQFPLFWTDERIKGITYWGYVVGQTWRNGTGLVNPDGTPRPALSWLMSYLGR